MGVYRLHFAFLPHMLSLHWHSLLNNCLLHFLHCAEAPQRGSPPEVSLQGRELRVPVEVPAAVAIEKQPPALSVVVGVAVVGLVVERVWPRKQPAYPVLQLAHPAPLGPHVHRPDPREAERRRGRQQSQQERQEQEQRGPHGHLGNLKNVGMSQPS
jgi:hypothetical protein